MKLLSDVGKVLLKGAWFNWGALPLACAVTAFWSVAIILECVGHYLPRIQHGKTPRPVSVAHLRTQIPVQVQISWALWNTVGPPAIAQAATQAVAVAWLLGGTAAEPLQLPLLLTFLLHFSCLYLFGDLGLYWGHRVQHKYKCLWKFHSLHHRMHTPSPFSTVRCILPCPHPSPILMRPPCRS